MIAHVIEIKKVKNRNYKIENINKSGPLYIAIDISNLEIKSKYCNYIGVYTNIIINLWYIHIHPTRPNNKELTFRHLKTIIQFKTKLYI